MPNWCANNVTIYGPKAKVKAIKGAFEAGEFCQHILPNPKGEWDYNWSVNNWGTKWDVGGSDEHCDYTEVAPDRAQLELSFDSAWSPPVGVYEKLIEDEDIDCGAYYYEPGVAFCGYWANGSDECYEITGDSKWVKEEIPEAIDEMFAISDGMAEWENEEELSTWMREGAEQRQKSEEVA